MAFKYTSAIVNAIAKCENTDYKSFLLLNHDLLIEMADVLNKAFQNKEFSREKALSNATRFKSEMNRRFAQFMQIRYSNDEVAIDVGLREFFNSKANEQFVNDFSSELAKVIVRKY